MKKWKSVKNKEKKNAQKTFYFCFKKISAKRLFEAHETKKILLLIFKICSATTRTDKKFFKRAFIRLSIFIVNYFGLTIFFSSEIR